jgi:anti-sigma-K factor RskA
MTTHEWFVEHRASFVIRSLEPDEERLFHEHLPACEACRAEVGRLERDLAWLPMAVEPVTPRPGLTRRLVEGALGRRERRWPIETALAASLVLAAGAWGWALWRDRSASARQAGEVARLERALITARDTLAIMRNASRVAQASVTMGGRHGQLIIFADEQTHRWNVVVSGLPAAGPGEVCQFWFITDNGMVRGVEVRPGASGTAFLTMGMPPRGGVVMGAALTLEPAGGDSDQPKGPTLAHLMLES